MKNSLSDLYEKILLSEAQKNDLTSPSNVVVGDLKSNEEVFGEKPEVTKGPEKAKLAQGPGYKISTSSETAPTHGSAPKAKFKGTAPAKEEKYDEEVEEMEDEEVIPASEFDEEDEDESSKKEIKKEIKKESYTMSAFETLFKKTLLEQDEQPEMEAPETELSADEDLEADEVETEEEPMEEESEESEEESEDLVADLKDLQARLGSILDKLENYSAEEEEGEEEEGSYSEEEFDEEFGEEGEEAPVKESIDKPKLLSPSKGKSLMSKKNKVGKLAPKGGKASPGKFKPQSTLKAAPKLQKSKAEVKSTVKKGDFIK
jgi:hypothetical protein